MRVPRAACRVPNAIRNCFSLERFTVWHWLRKYTVNLLFLHQIFNACAQCICIHFAVFETHTHTAQSTPSSSAWILNTPFNRFPSPAIECISLHNAHLKPILMKVALLRIGSHARRMPSRVCACACVWCCTRRLRFNSIMDFIVSPPVVYKLLFYRFSAPWKTVRTTMRYDAQSFILCARITSHNWTELPHIALTITRKKETDTCVRREAVRCSKQHFIIK